MCEKKSLDAFKPVAWQNPITTWGEIENKHCNINTSSIWTKLIQEAGRWCKNHASDLLVDYKKIDTKVENGTLETESHLFGFRENGVDHDKYIFARYSEPGIYGTAALEYRAIWRLDITVEEIDPEFLTRKVTFSLYEVGR